MKKSEIIERSHKFAESYCVTNGKGFRLKDVDPADTGNATSEDITRATELLGTCIQAHAELQDVLYAQDRWSVLLIFQAMDAAGKDGAIKHVMSGVNPQGVQVYSFKTPSTEELNTNYLWGTMHRGPDRGRIGIFNRSYYEEVLVVRVHPELLKNERIPPSLVTKDIWKDRFQDIHCFERYLWRNGIIVRKFFLNVSKKEQKRRFLDRLDHPEKNWKFSAADVRERQCWRDYQKAYEDMIGNTSTKEAPWYVVPADNKWFTRLVVSTVVVDTLESLGLAYPKMDEAKRKELEAAKKIL